MPEIYSGWPPVGPQETGEVLPGQDSQRPLPVDAGGGFAGQYGDDVLSIFREGIQVWAQRQQQKDMMDYRRWEATRGGVVESGSDVGTARRAAGVQSTVAGVPVALVALLVVGLVIYAAKD